MKKSSFAKNLLRLISYSGIAVVIISLSVPAQAKPSAADSVSSIEAFQQVAAESGMDSI